MPLSASRCTKKPVIIPSYTSSPLSHQSILLHCIANCKLGTTDEPKGSSSLNTLAFNASCLCTPDTFREQAPSCIDCLFRGSIEEDAREMLLRGMDGCTKTLLFPACPRSCLPVDQLMKDCQAEDEAARVASSIAAAASLGTTTTTTATTSGEGTDTIFGAAISTA